MDSSLFYSFISTLAVVAIMISFASAVFSLTGFHKNKVQSSCCYLVKEEEEIKKSKPQTLFKSVLADNSYNPFQHLNGDSSGLNQQHPYEEEIQCFLQKCEEIQEFSFVNGKADLETKGSHVWVDKEHQLQELVDVLSKRKIFVVDTGQHSFRSFLGFTALMQISTRSEDYLLDIIALHDVMGVLCPVFANPKICKVKSKYTSQNLYQTNQSHPKPTIRTAVVFTT
ncbi:Rrp6-like [Thalictrum thalictroides]|uniref:Rrp6-like n=1 Tax=Thalictrum thalictroides TaxID=46969 RepID=A0A7J6VLJ2_THATH|nr:Rrp6-like [Thalictrum thalictroides]